MLFSFNSRLPEWINNARGKELSWGIISREKTEGGN